MEEERALKAKLEAQKRSQERTDQTLSELQQIERQLYTLDGEDTSGEVKQYNLRYQIRENLPLYEQEQRQVLTEKNSLLEQLAASIDHIKVPPPWHPAHYASVLLLGYTYSPDDAKAYQDQGLKNPFLLADDGRPAAFGGVFAFGQHGRLQDLPRVLLDHLMGEADMLSPATVSRFGDLRGATADEVDAYSNGGMVAEVMISKGLLKGVKELRLFGGDGSLMSLESLEKLATEKDIASVDVYVTQNDPIVLTPRGWRIRACAEALTNAVDEYLQADRPEYRVLGLVRSPNSGYSRVHVHFLSYPPSENPYENHKFDTYWRIANALRIGNFLDAHGALRPQYLIQK